MSASSPPSLTGRAILAVFLMIGFYLLALAIIAALVFALYAMFVYGHMVDFRVSLFVIVGAGLVLWSIIPRRDRFVAPGPLLTRGDQPDLFAAVDDLAKSTEQKAPREIYLVPDMNAGVANRGGVMGIGSRRVMLVGLPLLQVLTVSEFRAVLAHEFGHYYGGDTKLGPWVYKTRWALLRTIFGLSGFSSILRRPFLWYGKMFLRVTQAISRRQELAADALASRVAGRRALVDGLKKLPGHSLAHHVYWQKWVVPVLDAGFYPPLVEGFNRYLTRSSVTEMVDEFSELAVKEEAVDRFDSHPSLHDRIQAVEASPLGEEPGGDMRAITLLRDISALESELFSSLARLNEKAPLRPLGWEGTGTEVFLPLWSELANEDAAYLEEVTPDALPGIAGNLDEWAGEFPEASGEVRRAHAGRAVGAALAVALDERGWRIDTAVPGAVRFQAGEMEIRPFEVMEDLAGGRLSTEVWQQQVKSAGISALELGTAVEETSRTVTIKDILDYFDEAASDDTLKGVGLSRERRNVVRDMLLQAQTYLNEGNTAAARAQLEAVCLRCDRQPIPSAYVFGDAAEYLAEMVRELTDELEE